MADNGPVVDDDGTELDARYMTADQLREALKRLGGTGRYRLTGRAVSDSTLTPKENNK